MDDQRRTRVLVAAVGVAAVIAVLAGVVIVKLLGGAGSPTPAVDSGLASSAVHTGISSVPAATFDAVGVGAVQGVPTPIEAPALTAAGLPRVLYVGAEYCPFCAAQRWGMVVALARFGTWKDLRTAASSSDDVYPSTPTLSFHGAVFTSDLVSFTGVETSTSKRQGNGYTPLDRLSDVDAKILDTYDKPPYVPAAAAGSIPFIDFGGRYLMSGASFSPGLLAGRTQEQIAAGLSDPKGAISQAVDGTANVFTAAICTLTAGKPETVCTSSGVSAAAKRLAGS